MVSQYGTEEENLRLYALQALANALRTGCYDEDILNALTVNYYAEGENFDIASKLITINDLNMLQKREKNISGRNAGNWLEGGGLQLLMGVSIIVGGAVASNRAKIAECVERTKQSVKGGSAFENYKKLLADNRGGINIPKEVVIINKKYSGKTYKMVGEMAGKYPNGVKFSEEGFPDFKQYSNKTVEIEGLKGDTYYDFVKANKAVGYKTTPKGYTWHHVEDGKTMMLVPRDLHSAVRHTGGASLIRKGIRP